MPEPSGAAQHRRRRAVDGDLAARRLLEVGEDPQDRRLAAARRSEQGDELAACCRELEVVDGHDRAAAEAELLAQPADVTGRSIRRRLHDHSGGRPSLGEQLGSPSPLS